MDRCLNIDWLTVYGVASKFQSVEESLSVAYKVIDNERGTPMFKKWYTVQLLGRDVAQVCCFPYSLKSNGGIFKEDSMTIQICNRFLYDSRLLDILRHLSDLLGFKLISISRIDICMDFVLFDNGMKPQTLIRGFYSSKYLKKGRSMKGFGVGVQFSDYSPESLSFSGKHSAISVKLYDKSKEMEEVKAKRYIQDAWLKVLGTVNGVWRLEFSLKSDGQGFVDKKTGEYVKVTIADIRNRDLLMNIFRGLVKNRFTWLVNDIGKRREKMKELQLFKWVGDVVYTPSYVTGIKDVSAAERRFFKKIVNLIHEESLDVEERDTLFNAACILSKKYRIDIEQEYGFPASRKYREDQEKQDIGWEKNKPKNIEELLSVSDEK